MRRDMKRRIRRMFRCCKVQFARSIIYQSLWPGILGQVSVMRERALSSALIVPSELVSLFN